MVFARRGGNMGKVVIVVGLPGCGKSYHLKKLEANGFERFDDFKAEATNDSPQFKDYTSFT